MCHGWVWPGHPRLVVLIAVKTWMAGMRPAMTRGWAVPLCYSKPQVGWDIALIEAPASCAPSSWPGVSRPSALRRWGVDGRDTPGYDGEGVQSPRPNLPAVCGSAYRANGPLYYVKGRASGSSPGSRTHQAGYDVTNLHY